MTSIGLLSGTSLAAVYVGGGIAGDWTDNANWTGSAPTGATVSGLYFKNGTDTPALYTSTQGTTLENFDINIGQAGTTGSLTITGGTLNINNTWGIIIGQQGVGNLIIDGGSLNQLDDNNLRFGNAAGTATVSLLSGSFTTAATAAQVNANATISIVDGTASFGGTFSTIAETAQIDFTSGGTGSLSITGADLAYYEGLFDDGNLSVDGDETGVFADHFSVSGTGTNLTITSIPPLVWDTVSDGASALKGNIQINQGALNLDAGLGLPDDLTIMPLGDSITYGYGGPGGYRLPLYHLLSPIASGFQFVGDSTEGSSDLPVNQKSHAGHSSYTSVDIKNNLNGLDSTRYLLHSEEHRDPHGGFWLTGGNGTGRDPLFPNVVLLLAGTNDVNILSGGIPEYAVYYTNLVTEITTLRPGTHVFLAKITPRSSFHQKTDDYNAAIQQVYNSFQTAGKNVYLVDLYTGYTGGWVDGVHPNLAGYNWMATQWYNALISNLGVPQNINISQVPTVTIGSGATMTGQGKVNNLVLEGFVSPGSGIGSLTTTGTTITGACLCDLNAESTDSLVVEGNLTLTSATLTLNSLETASATVYPVYIHGHTHKSIHLGHWPPIRLQPRT
jgi:lysophospholipase L1-like esterase